MKSGKRGISIIVGLALVALVPVHGEAQTWAPSSPGAGGAFTSVDVSANGTVLVGSDLSGLYKRTSSTDYWTRIGYLDGIKATAVDAVKWKPGDNNYALAGTRNGLYRTTDGGSSWSVVSGSWNSTVDVTAIGWSPTTTSTVYMATVDSGDDSLFGYWKSTNSGASFSSYTHGVPDFRRIVKILVDPKVSDGEKVYLVSGNDQGRAGYKEIHLADNGGTFSLISGSHYAIDVAVDSTHSGLVLMTTSINGPTGGNDNKGTIQMSTNDGGAWNKITHADSTTGAIWFNGGKAYAINVQQDACSGGSARAGKFLLTSGNNWATADSVTISRQDDGIGTQSNTATWDAGWTDCPHARGRALSSVAFTLSARGEYWVTSQFVWRHNTSGAHKYENVTTTGSGSPYQTRGIDNANPWVIAIGNSPGTVWAGYHDLGIWKSTDGLRWTNKNPDLGTWDTYGGNASSILVGGADTVFAAMAENDNTTRKGEYFYDFNLYRTTDGGTNWSTINNNSLGTGFIYSLHKNSTTGRMWATMDGRAYYTNNRGDTWTAASDSLPTDGIYVVTTINNVVLAGGWAGLWRSADHGITWHQVGSSNGFDFRGVGTGDTLQLQHVSWRGIHQILVDENLWVVSYVENGYSGSKNKGIWRSSDLSSTFTVVMDSTVRRGVAVDSCYRRVHITSGTPHTSGTNNTSALNGATGKQTCPLDISGNFVVTKCKVEAAGPDYRYRFGGAIVASGYSDYVYVGVPGYGLMRQTLATGGSPQLCETELHGGGGDMSARRLREEGPAPAIEPNILRLEEAYDREFYDLSGRKVKVTKPGVYFERRVLPGKVTRRTVVVTS